MGKADVATREYLRDPARFADAFNYAVYGGEHVVRAEELKPVDSTSFATLPKSKTVEKHRDGIRLWQAMSDEHAAYALFGIEGQTNVHYAMPVRCMLYDALTYAEQVSRLGRGRRKGGGESAQESSAEFLSGMGPGDRLIPVVTLVVHFGPDEWDGQTSLRGLLGPCDERLLALAPDYRINLVSPATMGEGDFHKFETDLGLVLEYIRYSRDKERLSSLVAGDARFASVDAQTARLINVLTDSRLDIGPGEETVDMCKAIEDMRREAMDEGRRDGERKGRRKGRREGMLATLDGLVHDGVITLAEAARRSGLTAEEFAAELANM